MFPYVQFYYTKIIYCHTVEEEIFSNMKFKSMTKAVLNLLSESKLLSFRGEAMTFFTHTEKK
jgi:hypothetical protein